MCVDRLCTNNWEDVACISRIFPAQSHTVLPWVSTVSYPSAPFTQRHCCLSLSRIEVGCTKITSVTAVPFWYGWYDRNSGTPGSCLNAERISCLFQVTLYASAGVTSGNYSLTHTSMWANATTGNLNSRAETTVCLDWNAGEDEARVSSPSRHRLISSTDACNDSCSIFLPKHF